jgi:hypothetical protein
MRRHLLRTVLLALVVTSAPGLAAGQVTPLQQRLAKATSLTCTFALLTTGNWKEGAPAADVKPATLKMAFTEVDTGDGTARATGNFGDSTVVVRYVNDYLHLMQIYGAGPLYTTTVFARETKDGRLMAVHTRHEYVDVILPGFTSRPEMYLGDCALGP